MLGSIVMVSVPLAAAALCWLGVKIIDRNERKKARK